MDDLGALNRLLNRCARDLNDAAVAITKTEAEEVRSCVALLVGAIAKVTEIQAKIFRIEPELEYHYDPNRKPTAYMRELANLAESAKAAERKGDLETARRHLVTAMALEPPALTYEALSRALSGLSQSKG